MSVQITDAKHVCLFCNTTDTAFGPIFDSQDDAEDFLVWLAFHREDGKDARRFTNEELTNLQLDWEAEREVVEA